MKFSLFFEGNKLKFVSLKKSILILVLFLSFGAVAIAQTDRSSETAQKSMVKMVRFYPNPASSFINFDFQENPPLTGYSFKIYNFIGKKVLEINNITPRTVLNLNDYFRGVYIFQLTDRNGKVVESGKFQVVK
jgi:hypothetical protein